MGARDSVETDTRVVDAPDVPRETTESPRRRRRPPGKAARRIRRVAAASRWPLAIAPIRGGPRRAARFDLKRAGLPDMSIDAAAKYIAEHRESRPWLAMTDRASPEARRIIAAMDAAGGHAHIRHEGWVTEEANRRRVTHREDPAQLDPEKRSLGIDGLRPDGPPHWCRASATRIGDPDAFATAFVRGVEHPKVREVLDRPIDSGKKPKEVALPITDLLGPDGNRPCTGWRLEPVNGSMKAALGNRDDWIKARSEGRTPDGPEPRAAPVSSFEGGGIVFAFMRNNDEQRYEVVMMYARPAQPKSADNHPDGEQKEQHDGIVLLGTPSGRPVRYAHCGRDNVPRSRELRSGGAEEPCEA